MFKVVPDQLKISDGWVRCGHCADVFDATLYLDGWTDDEPAPVAEAEQQATPTQVSAREQVRPPNGSLGGGQSVRVPDAASESLPVEVAAQVGAPSTVSSGLPWPFDDDAPGEVLSGFSPLAESDGMTASAARLPERVSDALTRALYSPTAPVAQAVRPVPHGDVLGPEPSADKPAGGPAPTRVRRGVTEDFHAELLQFASSTSSADPPTAAAVDLPIGLPLHAEPPLAPPVPPQVPDRDAPPPSLESILPEAEVPDAVPQFVQQARRKAFWRRPSVRAALSLLALCLGGALLAQWMYHERARVVAWQPQLESVVRWVCHPPACEIGPVRRIDDIVIESAQLIRRVGTAYAFDLVLKNRSDLPLAVPALELTLTDTRDQTVARRVFLPSEWPGQPVVVPARGSLSVQLQLAIDLGESVPMAGYRALVFYP